MDVVTVLWSLSAATAAVLAVVCGLLWAIERRDRASLALCAVGIAAAISSYIELAMMRSATAAEYSEWLRWYHLPVFVAITGLVLFVHYYLGTGRLWILRAFILARVVVLVVNFSSDPNVNFRFLDLLHGSFLREQVSVIGQSAVRHWQWFALASIVLLMFYLVDAVVRRWRQGDVESRRKALAVVVGITATMVVNVAMNQLIAFGFLHIPISNILWFVGALATMAYELGRDVMVSRRTRVELAELRARLAQLDRVSILSQLSSTLTHELTQPLTAALFNSEAALALVKLDKPDREELGLILTDIVTDQGRAVALLERMRELFKRQSIETQPLRVEEVVRDVVSLVHSQAVSRSIALDVRMPPNLPRVLGDRVHVSQVMLNLVMNSIDAVQARPVGARRIVLEARTDERARVELTVRDSGPGIPDSIKNDIFQPFFTTKIGGTGVGLALSRKIIEALEGQLWVEPKSQDNGGATFRFTLRKAQ
jgi:signal transduction histidine kinase